MGEALDSLIATIEADSGTFLLAALAVAAISLLACIGLIVRVRALGQPLAKVKDSEDTAAMLTSILASIDAAGSKIDDLTRTFNDHVEDSKSFIKYVGLVRYDAFDDIAGQQSYSLCVLDSHRNGFLLTYLTSPNTTRSYAVTVTGGEASRKLGDEERRALDDALNGSTRPEPEAVTT